MNGVCPHLIMYVIPKRNPNSSQEKFVCLWSQGNTNYVSFKVIRSLTGSAFLHPKILSADNKLLWIPSLSEQRQLKMGLLRFRALTNCLLHALPQTADHAPLQPRCVQLPWRSSRILLIHPTRIFRLSFRRKLKLLHI